MKPYSMFIVLMISLVPGGRALAQQALLLLPEKERPAIYKAERDGMRELARVGQGVLFGETDSLLVVISRRTPRDSLLLQVLDKKTERTTGPWQMPGFAALRLSGPAGDIAVIDKTAFYVGVRFGKDGIGSVPNELGGLFDLYRVSLVDGKVDRFPLKNEVSNPRVIIFAGTPLIYSWNGPGVWRFDTDNGQLSALVLSRDIDDTVVAEGSVDLAATTPRSTADYVAVDGAGLFRVSPIGGLAQILDGHLTRITAPPTTLSLRQKGDVLRVFAAGQANQRMVGLITDRGFERRYVAVDPATMRIVQESILPDRVILDSVTVARDGSLVYVDRQAAAIRRIAGTDDRVVWTLIDRVPAERLDHVRVLSFDP